MTVAIKLFTTFFKSLAKCRYISSHRQKKPNVLFVPAYEQYKNLHIFYRVGRLRLLGGLKVQKGERKKKIQKLVKIEQSSTFYLLF